MLLASASWSLAACSSELNDDTGEDGGGDRDATLHLTTLSGGALTDSSEDISADCTAPGHVTFIEDGAGMLVSCNGDSTGADGVVLERAVP